LKFQLGVSYYGNRIPWRVREDLEAIRQAGCTYVVHTFSEQDLEFYAGAMRQIIADSKALGLEVWLDPWGVGQAFGGETYSQLIAKDLTLRQIGSQGQSLPIACPNHPAFRDYLDRWAETAADLGADVLFWDEPHFSIFPEPSAEAAVSLWACRCPVCQELYHERMGGPMPDRLTAELRAFKEDCLVDLTRRLCEKTRALGLKSAVCLLPFESSSTVNDWEKIARIPELDILGTDPYWRPRQPDVAAFVGRAAARIRGLADRHGKAGQIWILNFNIPKGEEPKITEAVEAAAAAGIRNLAAWSYYGAGYIKIGSEDPRKVWETLGAAYRNLISA